MTLKDDFFQVTALAALAVFVLLPLLIFVSVFVIIPIFIIVGVIAWMRYLKRLPVPTEVLHAQTSAVFPDTEQFTRVFIEWLMTMDRYPCYPLFEAMGEIATRLYDQEEVQVKPMLLHPQGSVEEARYRDTLIAFQRKAADPERTLTIFIRDLMVAFTDFTALLPTMATTRGKLEEDRSLFHCQLTDLVKDRAPLIEALRIPPFDAVALELSIFVGLRKQLRANEIEASKGSKTVIAPEDYKKDDIVDAYLAGTPFSLLFEQQIPWQLPEETRFSGHWIVAPQGTGKTTLLTAMLQEDFKRDAAIIIFDGKGDLIDEVGHLQFLEDRYLILDPKHTGINPLSVDKENIPQAAERLEYVFSALLDAKITPLQSVLFRNVFRALVMAFPNPTLSTFQDLLLNGWEPYREYIDTLRTDLKDFFYKQYDRDAYKARRGEVLSRLELLTSNDHIRDMMLLPTAHFSLAEAMNAGKVIIINNSVSDIGEQGAEFLGRYFLSEIWAAAMARPVQGYKKPCYVYMDEAQLIIKRDEKVGQIIDECRSKRIALILAHQRTDRIQLPEVLTALSNCAIRYANSDAEANLLAGRMRTTPQHLQTLSVGQFAAFVRDETRNGAVTINVTPADFKSLPKIPPKLSPPPPAPEPEPVAPISPAPVPTPAAQETASWDTIPK